MLPINLKFENLSSLQFEGHYYLIAFICSLLVSYNICKSRQMSFWLVFQAMTFALFSGIMGAIVFQKIFYITISENTLGGMSITGALVLGPVFTFVLCKIASIDFWRCFNLSVPGIFIGISIGRIGCFLNGDGFGVPTRSILGIKFPRYGYKLTYSGLKYDTSSDSLAWKFYKNKGLVLENSVYTLKLHPTQLYESIMCFIFGLFMYKFYHYSPNKLQCLKKVNSQLPLFSIAYYCIIRFFIENYRADKTPSMQCLLGVLFIVLTSILIIGSVRKQNLFISNL